MGPRWTLTPVGGTSVMRMVLFSEAVVASERSKPTFLASTSNAATNSTSRRGSHRNHVHQPGHGRAGSRLVVLHALDEGRRTVADAHDCYSNRSHGGCSFLLREFGRRRRGRTLLGWLWPSGPGGLAAAFCVDQVGQPADLALDRLDRVAPQLGEVAVVAAGGVPGPVETLLEAANADPRGRAAGRRRRCGRRTRTSC